jgi:hypothetical protein
MRKHSRYSLAVERCQHCGTKLGANSTVVDAPSVYGPWGYWCEPCANNAEIVRVDLGTVHKNNPPLDGEV